MVRMTGKGNTGFGITLPDAKIHITSGTTSVAPLKFTEGDLLSSPEAGAMEFDGTDLFFTPSATRETVAFISDIEACGL